MNREQISFEDDLGGLLGRLAELSPPAPDAAGVVAALRRRGMKRKALGCIVGAAIAMIVTTLALHVAHPPHVASLGNKPSIVPARELEPIAGAASQSEIESALRRCFASANVTGDVFLTKDSAGVSFCCSGNGVKAQRLQADLTTVLKHYDTATVRLSGGQFSFTLETEGKSNSTREKGKANGKSNQETGVRDDAGRGDGVDAQC